MSAKDDLTALLQVAAGITEVTAAKAGQLVSGAFGQLAALRPAQAEQVQQVADDLIQAGRENRERLVDMVRTEVDRAIGRTGFVREDELAALRRHVQRLEERVARLESADVEPAQREDSVGAATEDEGEIPAKKKKFTVQESS